MAIRVIRKYPDPVLRKKAKEVSRIDPLIEQLIYDMAETMYDVPGVGLAAPQVGVSKRIMVIDTKKGALPLINPKILESSGKELGMEGCLSFPCLYGDVERDLAVTIKYQNLEGRWEKLHTDGTVARAIQHELDHLNGVLFIDKAVNLRYFVPEELKKAAGAESFAG